MAAQAVSGGRLRHAAVTGAGGFVGRTLCRLLVAQGVRVRALVRSAGSPVPPGCEARVLGDLADPAGCDWDGALDGGLDTVFHLAAIAHAPLAATIDQVNREASGALAEAAFRRGLRLVHTSTIKVYGDQAEGRLDEHTPMRPDDAYGRSKLEGEQRIAEVAQRLGGDWIGLRPPIVFGPGDAGNFARLVKLGCSGLPLPLGAVGNRRSMIHGEALGDALLAAARLPQGTGRCYGVAGGPAWSTADWLRSIAHAAGRPSRLWPCPPGLLRAAAGLAGASGLARRLLGSLEVDDRAWRQASDWQPPFSQEEAVRRTVQALLLR